MKNDDIDLTKIGLNEEQLKTIISILKTKDEIIFKQADELTKYQDANKTIEKLKYEVDYYRNLAGLRAKYIFAKKAETSGQLKLFDDAELNEAIDEGEKQIEKEDKSTEVSKARKKRAISLVTFLANNNQLPVEIKNITISDPSLVDIKSDIISRKICKTKAKYFIVETHIHQYKKKDDPNTTIIRPETNPTVLGGSQLDSSIVSSFINDKFVLSLPLYRIEQEYFRKDIPISRQTMSNNIFACYKAFKPILELIKKEIVSYDISRSDETELKVLEYQKDKVTTSKYNAYIWVFSTGRGHFPCYYYQLGPGRGVDVPDKFFGNSIKRYLQSDGYSAYAALNKDNLTTSVYCLTHMRRAFYKNLLKKDIEELRRNYLLSNARNAEYDIFDSEELTKHKEFYNVVAMIDSIYHSEKKINEEVNGKEDIYNLIKAKRLEIIKPKWDKLKEYVNDIYSKAVPGLALYDACKYFINRQEGFENIFKDGRLELDNNASERGVKDIVIGRKNWMFANTEKGADVTCGFYSLAMTCKANDINTEEYIKYLIDNLPPVELKGFDYTKFLPWNYKK